MENQKHILFIIILIFIGTSTTYAQDLIAVDKSEDVDLNSYSSYVWLPESNNPDSEDYISDRTLKLAIQQTIASELEARGYVLNSTDPDIFVSYKIVQEEIDPLNPKENEDDMKMETAEQSKAFNEGTLVIQFIDRAKEEVLWQGTAKGILQGNDLLSYSPSRNEGAINNEPENKAQLKDGGVSSNEEGISPDERAVKAIKEIFKRFEYSEED